MCPKVDIKTIELPKILKKHKAKIYLDKNKIFCSYFLKDKEYLSRVLIDKNNNPQFIMSYNFIDDIAPGEIEPFLPNLGFISKDAKDLWEIFLYPVTMTELKRLSDAALIKSIKENSYDLLDMFFT